MGKFVVPCAGTAAAGWSKGRGPHRSCHRVGRRAGRASGGRAQVGAAIPRHPPHGLHEDYSSEQDHVISQRQRGDACFIALAYSKKLSSRKPDIHSQQHVKSYELLED